MATTFRRSIGALSLDKVLLAERYHPRKEEKLEHNDSVPLGEIVADVRDTISPTSKRFQSQDRFKVYDTSDAEEGFLRPKIEMCGIQDIGSAKKLFLPGDVLISRLRPYLRQVAFVPRETVNGSGNVKLVCSTEFHVLRSRDTEQSAAFLVLFLLSSSVQDVLSLSQEGGHHPRFNLETLMRLPVPKRLIREQEQVSETIEKIISQYQNAVIGLGALVREFGAVEMSVCEKGKPAARRVLV